MPIYEYRRPDGSTFELVQSFSEAPLTEDPESGVPVERVLHAPAVHFKGKGFYNTDYGTRKRQRENDSSAKSQEKEASANEAKEGSAKEGSAKETSAKETSAKQEPAKSAEKSDTKPVAAAS